MASLILLLGELRQDRRALTKHLAAAAAVELGGADDADFALFALSVHHAYTALESIMERVHRQLLAEAPAGADWHRRLLDDARLDLPGLRPPLLSVETVRLAHELRGFRHVVRHAYEMEYDRARLLLVQHAGAALAEALAADLDALEGWLGSLAEPVR